jgi:NADH-quinone oxidoreductase subunit L
VDEIYNWLVVRPLRVGSEKILWQRVDAEVIDGFGVNGTGRTVAGVGGLLRRIQSGNIRSYATWVLLGATVWLAYVLWPR